MVLEKPESHMQKNKTEPLSYDTLKLTQYELNS